MAGVKGSLKSSCSPGRLLRRFDGMYIKAKGEVLEYLPDIFMDVLWTFYGKSEKPSWSSRSLYRNANASKQTEINGGSYEI